MPRTQAAIAIVLSVSGITSLKLAWVCLHTSVTDSYCSEYYNIHIVPLMELCPTMMHFSPKVYNHFTYCTTFAFDLLITSTNKQQNKSITLKAP